MFGGGDAKRWREIAEVATANWTREQAANEKLRAELAALRRLPSYSLNQIIERLQQENADLRNRCPTAVRRGVIPFGDGWVVHHDDG